MNIDARNSSGNNTTKQGFSFEKNISEISGLKITGVKSGSKAEKAGLTTQHIITAYTINNN